MLYHHAINISTTVNHLRSDLHGIWTEYKLRSSDGLSEFNLDMRVGAREDQSSTWDEHSSLEVTEQICFVSVGLFHLPRRLVRSEFETRYLHRRQNMKRD